MELTSASAQAGVPVTFGQPFKRGDWLPNQGLVARDASGNNVPLQADEISTHRDGSVRFAVLSAQVPSLAANTPRIINLYTGTKTTPAVTLPASPAWNLQITARLSGNTTLVANPQQQLQQLIATGANRRLHGPVASEFTVVTPMVDQATGAAHPHLVARLHTRLYDGGSRIRTDVVMENNRTFTPNPSNLTYSLTVTANGQTLFSQPSFTHYHHARWHKVVWTGGANPNVRVRHNMPYFLASRATWNYDLSLQVPESVLASEASALASADTSPMGPAFLKTYFPNTGGRPEIGPLPRWTALYLVTQDDRARASMMAVADAAAGVPVHYRDENTGQPLDVVTYPNVTVRFGTSNPAVPSGSGSTIWTPDTAHQGSFAYIPYLITGDAFYLEETMFWAAWNIASANPSYRQGSTGLIKPEQVRGQAWALRSIGEAARALPDNHPMKSYFQGRLENNLNWYHQQYVNNPAESPMGAIQKPDEVNETSPWQNDFMGVVMSQLAENNEPKAQEIVNWFSKFNVGRFVNDANGFCAAHAPGYYWIFRDSSGNYINSWSALYAKNYAGDVGKSCASLSVTEGYPTQASGYAAYARGMLGAAAGANVANARDAYIKWKGMTPGMDAKLVSDPTWAIVPR